MLPLMKSMHSTRQAARQSRWHERISGWRDEHEYNAVNNDKTMFMKWEGSGWIMHEVFVDDMAQTSTSKKMLTNFFKEYGKDFDYTGGDNFSGYGSRAGSWMHPTSP